jgi:hypothetical protein
MTSRRARTGSIVLLWVVGLAAIGPRPARAQVTLEYKFPEGKVLTYKTTTRARQVLSLMGMDVETTKKETREWSRSVGKRRGDSSVPIAEMVRSLQVEYNLPGGTKLVLDSSKPNLKIDNPQLGSLGDVFLLESAIAYTVVLDKQNHVQVIEGTEPLREKAGKLTDPIVRQEAQSEIGGDRLKTRFEQTLRTLPDGPVRTGEPWERTEVLEINGKTFTIRKRYEYRGTEKKGDKDLEKIGSKILDIKYDLDTKGQLPLKVIKSDLKVESSEGTILFDREQGHVVSASDRTKIKGEVGYSGAGVEQSGAFDLTLSTNTQLQAVPKP